MHAGQGVEAAGLFSQHCNQHQLPQGGGPAAQARSHHMSRPSAVIIVEFQPRLQHHRPPPAEPAQLCQFIAVIPPSGAAPQLKAVHTLPELRRRAADGAPPPADRLAARPAGRTAGAGLLSFWGCSLIAYSCLLRGSYSGAKAQGPIPTPEASLAAS